LRRRTQLFSWLYNASATTRDFEVITGADGVARFAKRRVRRVERRKGLGCWYRKTGL
jgi:hypothetical protein